MQLEPRTPPGRSNRKARAYGPEIARLRNLGYSLEAIRAALADAGVTVSKSTVQREAARVRNAPRERKAASTSAGSIERPSMSMRSGRDIARDFLAGHITNPLVQKRRQQP